MCEDSQFSKFSYSGRFKISDFVSNVNLETFIVVKLVINSSNMYKFLYIIR